MQVPQRTIFKGDVERCKALVGDARRVMHILENMMELRGLQQLVIRKVPYPGALITCSKVFGMRTVEIIAGEPSRKKKTSRIRECYCFPHFSFGVVRSITPTVPVFGVDPETGEPMQETTEQFNGREEAYQDALPTVRFTYDVDVCAGKRAIPVEDVIDANFGKYEVGQYVLVTMATEMEEWEYPLDCDRPCLMSDPRFDKLMISPLHILPSMKPWKYGPEMEVVS